jgi:hypothetical protein
MGRSCWRDVKYPIPRAQTIFEKTTVVYVAGDVSQGSVLPLALSSASS